MLNYAIGHRPFSSKLTNLRSSSPYLQFKPAGWLIAGSIGECSSQSLLAVGGVAGGTLLDETPEVLDKLVGGGKAPHTEGKEDPASSVTAL